MYNDVQGATAMASEYAPAIQRSRNGNNAVGQITQSTVTGEIITRLSMLAENLIHIADQQSILLGKLHGEPSSVGREPTTKHQTPAGLLGDIDMRMCAIETLVKSVGENQSRLNAIA